MTDTDQVSQIIFYALFRIVEIDELSGPEAAIAWARSVLDDPQLRDAFAENVGDRV